MPRTHLTSFTAPPSAVVAALDALREREAVPADFPPDALAEASAAARAWEDGGPERFLAEGHGDGVPVRDARDLPLVTVDPPGSMDLDQAVLLERMEDGRASTEARPAYRVTYAIASLATFVAPGGVLDAELRRRGETVYAPDRSTPLHPEALSHGAASLLPDVDRPACLWTIELDAAGRSLDAQVERALVRSRARLSYAGVQAALDAGPSRGDRLPAPAPADLPELLREIGELRQECEAARGGISLATPEQEIEALPGTDGGDPTAGGAAPGYHLRFRAALPVENWNAQISLLTGMSAARIMVDAGVGILRTMPPAKENEYARLRRMARALGIDWPRGLPYPALVRSLDPAVPAHAAFFARTVSLFRGAGYLAFGVGEVPVPGGDGADGAADAGHAAIAARYAHVTAPLRRLVDRYGEEICVAACAGRPVPQWVRAALPELPGVMETTGKRSRAVERGALGILEALVLSGHEGEVFDGVVVSAREGRGEVALTEPAVVAPLRPERGEDLPLGKRARVRLEAVDVGKGDVGFVLA